MGCLARKLAMVRILAKAVQRNKSLEIKALHYVQGGQCSKKSRCCWPFRCTITIIGRKWQGEPTDWGTAKSRARQDGGLVSLCCTSLILLGLFGNMKLVRQKPSLE